MLRIMLTAALAILLTARGGGSGDPEPDDGKVPPPGPVNCDVRPELCK